MSGINGLDHLSRAAALAADLGATSLVVCDRERKLFEWGAASALEHCRSIRKPLLGALFGRLLEEGLLDLDLTLAELGIDDSVPPRLTESERSARLRHLLSSCSGVYHPSNHAGAEGGVDADPTVLPARGSRVPGELFVYNNWDFNVLGTILERAIGRSLFEEFEQAIAVPLGMEDFRVAAQRYTAGPCSEHRYFAFYLSCRDLARFGQLYLNRGRFGQRVVVSAAWIAESTRPQILTGRGPAYGYQWWVACQGELFAGIELPDGSFAGTGEGSFVIVIPALDRVVALLADPTRPGGPQRAAERPEVSELIDHAVQGAIPLPGPG
jgi:CubicO group peptidase (beta-lactamase class C family)